MTDNLFGKQEKNNLDINVKIIALGGAGCKILKRINSRLHKSIQKDAIDTSISSLNNLSEDVKKYNIAVDRYGGKGTDCDYYGLKEYLVEDKMENTKIEKTENIDLIIFISCLGYGSGSAILPWALEQLEQSLDQLGRKTIKLGFFIQPTVSENPDSLEIIDDSLKHSNDKLDSYLIISNDKLYSSFQGTLEDALHKADSCLMEIIELIIENNYNTINLDKANILEFFRNAGQIHFGQGKSKEETMIHMAIEESFEGTLLRPLPVNKPPHRALCWINGPPISACLHQEIVESISSRLSPAVNGKQGKINISINTMNQKMLEIHLMLSSKQGIA